jgi:integrase
MTRRVNDAKLETRSARAKLKARGRPYWKEVSPGVHQGYRRLRGKDGTFLGRFYVGNQDYEVERIGTADDYSDADGVAILDFWQAQAKVRERMVARARKADGPVPTVGTAVREYVAERDARETRRQGRPVRSDAGRLEKHVVGRERVGKRKAFTPTRLASVELRALDEDDLKKWQSGLPETLKGTSRRRTINDLRAALNAAHAKHRRVLDPSLPAIIKNGLKITNGHDEEGELVARDNQILDDAKITRLLRATKQVDAGQDWDGDLYRFNAVLAETGARFSQVARLLVGDCQVDRRRLLMPKSRKGHGKTGATPVPVSQDLIDALLPVVTGRPSNAPLLERWRHVQAIGGKWVRAERGAWRSSGEFSDAWAAIRERANLPGVVPYSLRHSSIVRALRANLPIRLVAALHDTSVVMIERHYAKWIADGLEELAAQALVPLLPRERAGRVVPLRRPRG